MAVKFTRAELDLIDDMAAIASAAAWGEGDYMDWGKAGTAKTFDSLRHKVWVLLSSTKIKENDKE